MPRALHKVVYLAKDNSEHETAEKAAQYDAMADIRNLVGIALLSYQHGEWTSVDIARFIVKNADEIQVILERLISETME